MKKVVKAVSTGAAAVTIIVWVDEMTEVARGAGSVVAARIVRVKVFVEVAVQKKRNNKRVSASCYHEMRDVESKVV